MPPDKRRKRLFKTWQLSWQLYGVLLCLGIGLGIGAAGVATMKWVQPPLALAGPDQISPDQISQAAASSSAIKAGSSDHAIYTLPQANVLVVGLASDAPIAVALSDELEPVETFAARTNPSYVINGGFFDPQNGKTTSYLTVNSQAVGDPADNERLVQNPDLQQYLPQILNRSEFRVYHCESSGASSDSQRYDIAFHDAALPAGCEIESAVGAGPQLLPKNTSTIEGFTDYKGKELIRDAIGSVQPNARSAVGIHANGSVYLFMVAKNADSSGMTLAELAEFARSIGIVKLLNLDGGSSSSVYIRDDIRGDQTYSGLSDADGDPIHRSVKSVITAGIAASK